MWTRDAGRRLLRRADRPYGHGGAVALLRGLRAVPARGDRPADLVPLLPPADHQRGVRRVRSGGRLPRAALPHRGRPLMGQVVVVRHGQASFGAEDYDVLSGTGEEQARVVGRSLAHLEPDLVVHGSLVRQRRTAELAASAAGWSAPLREDHRWDELDQFAQFATIDAMPDESDAGRLPAVVRVGDGPVERRRARRRLHRDLRRLPRPGGRRAGRRRRCRHRGRRLLRRADLRAGDAGCWTAARRRTPGCCRPPSTPASPASSRAAAASPWSPTTSTSTCRRRWSPTADAQRSGSGRNPA